MGREGQEEIPQVRPGSGSIEADVLGFMVGATISAKQNIHEGRDVGIVAGVAVAVVVPVVQFRGTNEHTQRADGEADIGVNKDRPQTTEGEEGGECYDGEPKNEEG